MLQQEWQYSLKYYGKYRHLLRRDLNDIPAFRVIRDFCETKKGGLILDVGCGIGYLLNWLSTSKNATGVGMDFTSTALKAGNKLFSNLTLVHGIAQNLPFNNGTFDCVIMFNVIEHIEGHFHEHVLIEVRRILKRGGFLIIGTIDKDSIYRALFIHDKTHVHEFGKLEFIKLCSKYFKVKNYVYTNSVGRFPKFVNQLFAEALPCDIILQCQK